MKDSERYRVLVSYLRTYGDLIVWKQGYGPTIGKAVQDADEQLRPGRWTRLVVSSSETILADLRNEGHVHKPGTRGRRFESVTIEVPAPQVSK